MKKAGRNIDLFWSAYQNFRLNFYKSICTDVGRKEEKVTVLEALTLEVIYSLENPTVNDVAKFLETSQPNAAYKVGTLEDKGYIEKVQSQEDRREFFLVLTDKYHDYAKVKNESIDKVFERVSEKYSDEEWQLVSEILEDLTLAQEPMLEEIL